MKNKTATSYQHPLLAGTDILADDEAPRPKIQRALSVCE